MSVLALRVHAQHAHPHADHLRIYTFAGPDGRQTTVVANLDTVYDVGDTVAVACLGTKLHDGQVIHETELRGVRSLGMALGRVNAELGTNLDAEFNAEPEQASGREFVAWTSLEQLHHVRKKLERRHRGYDALAQLPKIQYRAKVKLDGTNAAIFALDDQVFKAQSRTRAITPDEDNHGFAQWAHEHEDFSRALFERCGRAVIFGEWCGPGVQKRTAVSKIDRRIFAVFAIELHAIDGLCPRIIVDPSVIGDMLPHHDDVFVLPWASDIIEFDFQDPRELEKSAQQVNKLVAQVEQRDPWVAETFGQDGLGEGAVLYPVSNDIDARGSYGRHGYTELMFKAKGEKHQVVRQPKPAQIDPTLAAHVGAFVEMTLTPARLQQALSEVCSDTPSSRDIGPFLKWVAQDIAKECGDELAASGLEWKQVHKAISKAALSWLRSKTG